MSATKKKVPPTQPPDKLEEPCYCWDCCIWMEAESIVKGALDAYSGDFGEWCPKCGGDWLYFGALKEDR